MPKSSKQPTTLPAHTRSSETMRKWARAICLTAVLLAWAIKWGGLRSVGITWAPGLWILGWAPSYLVVIGLAFAWPALGRSLPNSTRWNFAPECLAASLIILFGEVSDLLAPEIGGMAKQTFSGWDLIAAIAGGLTAFGLHNCLRAKSGAPSSPD